MKRVKMSILFLIMTMGLAAATPRPSHAKPGEGDVPIPLGEKQKVELADGESYLLQGTIRIVNGRPFFEVDLAKHPWLANRKRRATPFYPIYANQPAIWAQYNGMAVQLAATARGAVMQMAPQNTYDYVIWLAPTRTPLPVADHR